MGIVRVLQEELHGIHRRKLEVDVLEYMKWILFILKNREMRKVEKCQERRLDHEGLFKLRTVILKEVTWIWGWAIGGTRPSFLLWMIGCLLVTLGPVCGKKNSFSLKIMMVNSMHVEFYMYESPLSQLCEEEQFYKSRGQAEEFKCLI